MQKHGKEWMDGREREKKRGKENKGGGRRCRGRPKEKNILRDFVCSTYDWSFSQSIVPELSTVTTVDG